MLTFRFTVPPLSYLHTTHENRRGSSGEICEAPEGAGVGQFSSHTDNGALELAGGGKTSSADAVRGTRLPQDCPYPLQDSPHSHYSVDGVCKPPDWSGRPESNRRILGWKPNALPLGDVRECEPTGTRTRNLRIKSPLRYQLRHRPRVGLSTTLCLSRNIVVFLSVSARWDSNPRRTV